MFLARGNKKEGLSEEQRERSFLVVSLPDAGPA
jgi:hypothetical protein